MSGIVHGDKRRPVRPSEGDGHVELGLIYNQLEVNPRLKPQLANVCRAGGDLTLNRRAADESGDL
jgi:hypothetical protein